MRAGDAQQGGGCGHFLEHGPAEAQFAVVSRWAAYGLVARSEVQGAPHALHTAKVSDHSPVVLSIQARGMLQAGVRPLARSTIRGGRFAEVLRRTLELWGFDRWEVDAQVTLYPLAVRSAARIVRDWRRGEEIGRQSATIVSAARAVAMQRPCGARHLIEHTPEAAE